MDERVTHLKTPEECEQFVRNVQGRLPELALQARQRAVELRAASAAVRRGVTTAVEREALAAVYAYEAVKSLRGRKFTASRTWQMIDRHGIIEAVERTVCRTKETAGYEALMAAGMEMFAFEAVVLRYPNVFSSEAVAQSTKRLKSRT